MNLFEQWAEAEKPAWQRRHEERAKRHWQKVAEVLAAKRRYQALRQEQREAIAKGSYSEALGELVGYLDTLSLRAGGGAELVGFVRQWCQIHAPSPELCHEALHLIAGAIVSLRESEGLPPFDDPIFDQSPNVFLKVREMLS